MENTTNSYACDACEQIKNSIMIIDKITDRIKYWDIYGRTIQVGVCKVEGCREKIEFDHTVCEKHSTSDKEY